jgi:hypothetical protein
MDSPTTTEKLAMTHQPGPPRKGDANVSRWLVGIAGAAFAALILWAVVRGDFMAEGAALVTMPWGRVTLADLYLGFFLYALAVFAIENSLRARLFWALPVVVLGNVWAALWVVVRWGVIWQRLRPAATASVQRADVGQSAHAASIVEPEADQKPVL